MLAKLWDLIVGQFCFHDWKTEESIRIYQNGYKLPVHFVKHLRCTKCGNWKRKKLRNA